MGPLPHDFAFDRALFLLVINARLKRRELDIGEVSLLFAQDLLDLGQRSTVVCKFVEHLVILGQTI